MYSSHVYDDVPVLVFEDWLFVGSERAASNLTSLREHGITHIFSAIGPSRVNYSGVEYDWVRMDDICSQRLDHGIDVFMKFVLGARMKGGKVLVHCKAGISRSVSMILAYMIIARNIVPEIALRMVRLRRPQACPNDGFWLQLKQIYNQVSNVGHLDDM